MISGAWQVCKTYVKDYCRPGVVAFSRADPCKVLQAGYGGPNYDTIIMAIQKAAPGTIDKKAAGLQPAKV